MKYILKSPLIIISFIIVMAIGYFVGFDISNDFLNLYISKMANLSTRYILITIIIFSNFLIYKQSTIPSIILRKKYIYKFQIYVIIQEIVTLLLIFIFFNLPIFILNFNEFINNIIIILKVYISDVLISMLIISIMKFIDVGIKNRAKTSGIFLICFAIIDILLDHFNYFEFNEIIFDFSFLFILPYNYSGYIYIFIFLFITIIILTALSIILSARKDYNLGNVHEEN